MNLLHFIWKRDQVHDFSILKFSKFVNFYSKISNIICFIKNYSTSKSQFSITGFMLNLKSITSLFKHLILFYLHLTIKKVLSSLCLAFYFYKFYFVYLIEMYHLQSEVVEKFFLHYQDH